MRLLRLLGLPLLALLALPAIASAEGVPPVPSHELLTSAQFYAMAAAALAQGFTYLLNHYGPQVSERSKVLVSVAFAALVGAVVQQLVAGAVLLDTNTLQTIGLAVASALAAHGFFWKPSGFSTVLGGGANKPGQPPPA